MLLITTLDLTITVPKSPFAGERQRDFSFVNSAAAALVLACILPRDGDSQAKTKKIQYYEKNFTISSCQYACHHVNYE